MCGLSPALSSTQTVQVQPLPRYLFPYVSRAIQRPGLKARPAATGQNGINTMPLFLNLRFHGVGYEDYCLLVCNAVKFGR
jgi:hypothetical protein